MVIGLPVVTGMPTPRDAAAPAPPRLPTRSAPAAQRSQTPSGSSSSFTLDLPSGHAWPSPAGARGKLLHLRSRLDPSGLPPQAPGCRCRRPPPASNTTRGNGALFRQGQRHACCWPSAGSACIAIWAGASVRTHTLNVSCFQHLRAEEMWGPALIANDVS